MKQATLAELTGLSIKTIQSWEIRGMNEAKAIRAVKVAKALKCQVEDLMEEE
jgi:DNA-binding XRE family transcriptional regulator